MAQHPNLAAALAAFQAELPKLVASEKGEIRGQTKDGRDYKYDYTYADLAQVTEVVSPALGRHGLSFSSRPSVTAAGFGLAYVLRHEGGEQDEGFWPLPDPARTTPQQMGSAITYARRYAFLAVTNTFPAGTDDDGKVASERPAREEEPRQRQQRNSRQQRSQESRSDAEAVENLGRRQGGKVYTDAEVLEQHNKINILDLDKAVKLYDWMAGGGRNLHSRGVEHPDVPGELFTATEVLAIRMGDLAADKDTHIADLDRLRSLAEDRGLLKVQVSETETLDEVLAGVRAIRNAERLDTEHAADARHAAAESFGDS